MVLSLQELCLISTRDNIENGKIRRLPLPPNLRQAVLDMILMHGTIKEAPCLETLGSVEFLDGMKLLNLRTGKTDDHKYLSHVAESLAISNGKNGETMGDNVLELRLNIYGRSIEIFDGHTLIEEMNFRSIVRLINRCRRLSTLNLDLLGSESTFSNDENEISSTGIFLQSIPTIGGLLNSVALQSCLSLMENLKELSIKTSWWYSNGSRDPAPLLTSDVPILPLKNLLSLNLDNVFVNIHAWRQLLAVVGDTLIHLRLKRLEIGEFYDDENGRTSNSYEDYLPFSLPHLKTLEICGYFLHCSQAFIFNLKRCSELEYVYLQLFTLDRRQDLWLALNQMNINLEIKMVVIKGNAEEILDDLSRFKLVAIFKEKITSVEIRNFEEWEFDLTAALKHMIDVCQNLIKFNMHSFTQLERGIRDARRPLAGLFENPERAAKLRKLILYGEFDDYIVKSIFDNCLNLDQLELDDCPQLVDDYLIEWARHVVKPSVFVLRGCDNIGDNGLIPVLMSSGKRLKKFISLLESNTVTNRTWYALIENCPYIEIIRGMSFDIDDLIRAKCLNAFIDTH